ncbi:hypothetical protein IQ264_14455 [Phormidium sp. LEGE 05292]|uniref:hypothetical protein n=1 Tax=[Phormidium] sp. LEGE 05292 TaxID=767427 RepID=UPI001881746A|nr:hypothetical protein [Phormidium sp. LEGE 05292]MBE9226626.1 hypothetical protein [Phormidium sp. LEGE 05292]
MKPETIILFLRFNDTSARRQKAEGRREEGFYIQLLRSFQLLNHFCRAALAT